MSRREQIFGTWSWEWKRKKKEVEHPRRHVPAFLYSVRLQVVLCFLAFKKRFGSGPEAAATAKKKGVSRYWEVLIAHAVSSSFFLLFKYFIKMRYSSSSCWFDALAPQKKTMQMPEFSFFYKIPFYKPAVDRVMDVKAWCAVDIGPDSTSRKYTQRLASPLSGCLLCVLDDKTWLGTGCWLRT